jgi:serine/threonine protein kinase
MQGFDSAESSMHCSMTPCSTDLTCSELDTSGRFELAPDPENWWVGKYKIVSMIEEGGSCNAYKASVGAWKRKPPTNLGNADPDADTCTDAQEAKQSKHAATFVANPQAVCLKIFNAVGEAEADAQIYQEALEEYRVMKIMADSHRGAKVYEFSQCMSSTQQVHNFIVMELFDMDLHDYMCMHAWPDPSLAKIHHITVQIVQGLKVLESNGLVHTDLKTENILVQQKPYRSTQLAPNSRTGQ